MDPDSARTTVTVAGSTRRAWAAAGLLACSLVCPVPALAADPPATAATRAEGLAAWTQVAGVLKHPRCLNCHQAQVPLQGDSRRLHVPLVVRGPGNYGVGAMTCANCHNAMGNNDTARVPGAPHWMLAPRSMLWQGLSDKQLCQQLKDPARNGKRTPAMLIEHMETEALVLWSWQPGAGREAVPMPHDQFVGHMKTWVAGGTPCPK